jgi:hypothetical protein
MLLESSNSRIGMPSLRSLISPFSVLFLELPMKLVLSVSQNTPLFLLILLTTAWLLYSNSTPVQPTSKTPSPIILALTLLGFFSLFSFAGMKATSFGYDNRGLWGLWVWLCLVLLLIAQRSRVGLLLFCCIFSANVVFFQQTLNDARLATTIRSSIVTSLTSQFQKVDGKKTETLIYVLAPCHSSNSINKLIIFCTTWDLTGALRLALPETKNLVAYPILNTIWGNPPKVQLDGGLSYIQGSTYLAEFDHTGRLVRFDLVRSPEQIESELGNIMSRFFALAQSRNWEQTQTCKIFADLHRSALGFNWLTHSVREALSHTRICTVDPYVGKQ